MKQGMKELAAVLESREDELWKLQNESLRLSVETDRELAETVARGIESIREAAGGLEFPKLLALLDSLVEGLRADDLGPDIAGSALSLARALEALRNGDEGAALDELVSSSGEEDAAGVDDEAIVDSYDDVDPEDLHDFCAESREHLQVIESELIAMEGSVDKERVAEIFRGVHSIKGGAQFLGLGATSAISHAMEGLMEGLRRGTIEPGSAVTAGLLRGVDALIALADGAESRKHPEIDVRSIVEQLEASHQGHGGEAVAESAAPSVEAADSATRHEGPDIELFAKEARENMTSVRALLDDIESLAGNSEGLSTLTRNLHTIKGLSGFVGVQELELVAGALEGLLTRVFRHRGDVPHDIRRAVESSLALLDTILEEFCSKGTVSPDIDPVIQSLRELSDRESNLMRWSEPPVEPPSPSSGPSSALAALGDPLANLLSDLLRGVHDLNEEAALRALDALEEGALLHGCDEMVAEAVELKAVFASLDQASRRARTERLGGLLPPNLSRGTPVARRAEDSTSSFEELVLSVPGIGKKKLTRLVETGIDSREAVLDAGMQGLLGTAGLNVEQAKMLLGNFSQQVSAPTQGAGLSAVASEILADDFDRELVKIYLRNTTERIKGVLGRIDDGDLVQARKIVEDLLAAAGYMGYAPLVFELTRAQEAVASESPDAATAREILSDLEGFLSHLAGRVSSEEPGLTPEAEAVESEELERIFTESASSHLGKLAEVVEGFLKGMREDHLSSIQHHLSCLSSSAANIGKQTIVDGSETLQAELENLWLQPEGLHQKTAQAIVERLRRMFVDCGLAAPAIRVELAALVEKPDARERETSVELPAEQTSWTPDVPEPERALAAPSTGGPPTGGPPGPPEQPPGSSGGGSLPPGDDPRPEAERHLVEAQTTLRVDTDKIDELMNMVAELVVNRSSFMVLGTGIRNVLVDVMESGSLNKIAVRDLRNVLNRYEEATTDLGRVSNQLQEGVMRIRMIPVKTLFSRVPRLVRDLAQREGCQVKVSFEGEDTELDKTVIEQLSDPLTHLIRNAVSHGIEPSADRAKASKPPMGNLKISARHEGNMVILEIEDDGRGIDHEDIRRRIVESGMVAAPDAARLNPRELLSFIFAPGFSTARTVSDISGRGVGLDVVKRNTESLGGQLDVFSEPGKYCRFSLRIPLTMAIMQALLVRVSSAVYSIPVSAVIQTVKITRDEISTVENQEVVTVRGLVTPLVRLDDTYSYSYYMDTEPMSESVRTEENEVQRVVVMQAEDRQIGMVVDELLGSQDIVIKSLEDDLVDARGIAGAAILGDGTVTLILDITELDKIARDPEHYVQKKQLERTQRLDWYLEHGGASTLDTPIN